jgi:DNA-binding NtrC family response regulator
MATILYIDDEPSVGLLLEDTLTRAGHRMIAARNEGEALQILTRDHIDLIISDARMPGLSGAEFGNLLAREGFDAPLIMLTADEDDDNSIATGVMQCLSKPVRRHQLELAVRRALEHVSLRKEIATLRREVTQARVVDRIIASTSAMRRILQMVAMVGPTRSPALLQGESGTGKKLLARAMHDSNAQPNTPFICVSIAALPEGLVESALFGHERGAFAGAVRRTEGAFENAAGGTLVLDEVESLPPEFQAKLLDALDAGEFTRVGGMHRVRIAARVIATASRRLTEEVAAGRFRQDLYRKLSTVVLDIPPLRERHEDIPALAQHFARQTALEVDKPAPAISAESLAILRDYSWPGNVRELRHTIERAVILSQDPVLQPQLFDQERGMHAASLVHQVMQRAMSYSKPALNVGLQARSVPSTGIMLTTLNVDEAERALITRALEVTGGNRTRTAELLGISVRTLRNKLNGPQRVTPASS